MLPHRDRRHLRHVLSHEHVENKLADDAIVNSNPYLWLKEYINQHQEGGGTNIFKKLVCGPFTPHIGAGRLRDPHGQIGREHPRVFCTPPDIEKPKVDHFLTKKQMFGIC